MINQTQNQNQNQNQDENSESNIQEIAAATTSNNRLLLTPTWEILQETAARLLFMTVHWVHCLIPFQTLSKHDQLILLQESWKELFLLNLAQWSVPWDLSELLLNYIQTSHHLSNDFQTLNEIKHIQVFGIKILI